MSHSILIAEDDVSIRRIMRRALETADYCVAEAANGNEAIRAASAASFDVAVIDIFMPERDGMETILYLRRVVPDVKIIAITGSSESVFLESAVGLGATRVLTKPFRPQTLVDLIGELLRPTIVS